MFFCFFYSFPWLLKCHRVSWFECKVAQLAPITLNVKTCEDSLLNQPQDRLQNTAAALVSRPSTSGPLTTVDPPYQTWAKLQLRKKRLERLSQQHTTKHKQLKLLKRFSQWHFTRSATSIEVVLSQSGWMVVLLILTVYWQNNVINHGQTPWQPTCPPCKFFSFARLYKKAISVRIESSFVIGLPYSTVI